MTDLTPRPIGRPRSCFCGTCSRCKRADYMRAWWGRKTLEERRAAIARRDPQRVAAAESRRSSSDLKRESIVRSQQRHPDHMAARRRVHAAVRNGTLVKAPCWCGAVKVEAHHPDYTKPLDVMWLCRRHHSDEHLWPSR